MSAIVMVGDPQIDIPKLLRFEGYGPRNPTVFFIGLEERSPAGDLEHIRCRSRFGADRMDLKVACDVMFGAAWWGSKKMKNVRVWQVAAHIRAAVDNEPDWRYERDRRLGRSIGDTLLTEVLPIPRTRVGVWPEPYRDVFGFDDDDEYQLNVRAERMVLLKRLLQTHRPRWVFCYGWSERETFMALFPKAAWRIHTATASRGRTQRFAAARSQGATVVITRHYTGRKMKPFTSAFVPSLVRQMSRLK